MDRPLEHIEHPIDHPDAESWAMDEAVDAGPPNCTCYPGEGPLPCPHKNALRDCWRAAVLDETRQMLVTLKNQDRSPAEELLLDYLKRVHRCLDV